MAGLVGFVEENLIWYLASSLWIDEIFAERDAVVIDSVIVANGVFSDADAAHGGSGNASFFKGDDGSHASRFIEF